MKLYNLPLGPPYSRTAVLFSSSNSAYFILEIDKDFVVAPSQLHVGFEGYPSKTIVEGIPIGVHVPVVQGVPIPDGHPYIHVNSGMVTHKNENGFADLSVCRAGTWEILLVASGNNIYQGILHNILLNVYCDGLPNVKMLPYRENDLPTY
jgi:hypothetical protein